VYFSCFLTCSHHLLIAADFLVLTFGLLAWALKDYEDSDLATGVEEIVAAAAGAGASASFYVKHASRKPLSVTQKLKIGLEHRAILGDVKAQFQMGNLYAREGDSHKACDWYRQAANHGNKEAQLALANCYAIGNGVSRDGKLAVWWYQQASEQGVAEAKARLASFEQCLRSSGSGSDSAEVEGQELSRIVTASKELVDARAEEIKIKNKKAEVMNTNAEMGSSPQSSSSRAPPITATANSEAQGAHPSTSQFPAKNAQSEFPAKNDGNPVHRDKTSSVSSLKLEVGSKFWGFVSHSKLWREPVKIRGKISGGVYPNYVGEWTAVGRVTCESQAIFINIKAYGVVILGDRTTQAHLVFVSDRRMEGEVFQEGVAGGSAVLEVQDE